MTVAIVDTKTAPADVVHPAALAPVDASTGTADIEARLQAGEKWRWQPEKSPEGPVSIMLSAADQRDRHSEGDRDRTVARHRQRPGQPVGTHAFIVRRARGRAKASC